MPSSAKTEVLLNKLVENGWRCLPTSATENDQEQEPELIPEGITFAFNKGEGKDVSLALRRSIRKLHINTGHAAAEDMCRCARLAGGSETAIRCIKALRCSA